MLLGTVALLAAGCAGPSAPTDQGGGAVLTTPKPEAMRTRGWLQFPELTLHSDAESEPPKDPYIRGVIVGGRFYPHGELVGPVTEAPPKRILARGWLELETRAFTPEAAEGTRRAPWVEGWRDTESGVFFPSGPLVLGSEAPTAP